MFHLHPFVLIIQRKRLQFQALLCKRSGAAVLIFSACRGDAVGKCMLRAVCAFWQVGAIIGKGGEVISQLKTVIGVKIRISDRDDFVPGTRNRKVTISGAADAVQIAQVLHTRLS